MSHSELKLVVRKTVGSRDARKLRREGRIPASLQSDGGKEKGLNVHLGEVEFLASRRHHVHLFFSRPNITLHPTRCFRPISAACGNRISASVLPPSEEIPAPRLSAC